MSKKLMKLSDLIQKEMESKNNYKPGDEWQSRHQIANEINRSLVHTDRILSKMVQNGTSEKKTFIVNGRHCTYYRAIDKNRPSCESERIARRTKQ